LSKTSIEWSNFRISTTDTKGLYSIENSTAVKSYPDFIQSAVKPNLYNVTNITTGKYLSS